MESQPQNPEFRINSENFHPRSCSGVIANVKVCCTKAGTYTRNTALTILLIFNTQGIKKLNYSACSHTTVYVPFRCLVNIKYGYTVIACTKQCGSLNND